MQIIRTINILPFSHLLSSSVLIPCPMPSFYHQLTATIILVCFVVSVTRIEGFANPLKKVSSLKNLTTKQKFKDAATKDSLIFIDVENLRGKSGFELTHADVIHSISIWAKEYGLEDRVSLLVDHGSVPSGYYVKDKGLCIIFAGKKLKADDIIVRDIPFCQRQLNRNLIVVTQDYELIQRCKAASQRSGGKELSIVPPLFLLADLQNVVGENLIHNIETEKENKENEVNEGNDHDSESTINEFDEISSEMEIQITLGAQLIAVENQLRSKGKSRKSLKNLSSKRRRKLEKQANKIRAKLGLTGGSVLDRATSILANEGANENGLDSNQQSTLLKKWESLRQTSKRKEMTGDRLLLAERLRRELEVITGSYTSNIQYDLEAMVPAEAHAKYVNTLIPGINLPANGLMEISHTAEDLESIDIFERKESLRVVIVSDTHGCERSLSTDDFNPWLFTNDSEEISIQKVGDTEEKLLPDGDILLHLGDFAVDRGGIARRKALERFDKWLALQSHPMKIVLRGNHDPYKVDFPLSQAKYVTQPTSLTIGGKVIAIVPFGHAGFSSSKLKRSYAHLLPSKDIDILATHEPPHNILDKCLSGDRAGSSLIRLAVENMKELQPKLWVCGHIHEGRGSLRTTFGSKQESRETLVINAANANPGRAHHLDYGPVVVDVPSDGDILDGSEDKRIERKSSTQKRKIKENEQQLLLAVDLGLKCGASLFDDSGKLLRYEQLKFSDPKELYQQAPQLIDDWERDINVATPGEGNESVDFDEKKKIITYLAVEGGGELFDAWETSIESDDKKDRIQLVSVRPEEWRSRLLLPKERQSSRTCKEAARLIARQVVSKCGDMPKHEGKFKTDAAESVAMGYFLANQLGWITREPILDRYTNGKIVVP